MGQILERDPSATIRPLSSVSFDPSRLLALLAAGIVGLGIWIGVVLTVPPQRLLTYLAFFLPFWVFVACFSSAAIYWMMARSMLSSPLTLPNSVREGALIGGVLTVNLALVAGHKWSVVALAVTILLALGVEVYGQYKARGA